MNFKSGDLIKLKYHERLYKKIYFDDDEIDYVDCWPDDVGIVVSELKRIYGIHYFFVLIKNAVVWVSQDNMVMLNAF